MKPVFDRLFYLLPGCSIFWRCFPALEGLIERFLSAIRTKLDEVAGKPEAFGEKSKKGYREARVILFLILLFIKFTSGKNDLC